MYTEPKFYIHTDFIRFSSAVGYGYSFITRIERFVKGRGGELDTIKTGRLHCLFGESKEFWGYNADIEISVKSLNKIENLGFWNSCKLREISASEYYRLLSKYCPPQNGWKF